MQFRLLHQHLAVVQHHLLLPEWCPRRRKTRCCSVWGCFLHPQETDSLNSASSCVDDSKRKQWDSDRTASSCSCYYCSSTSWSFRLLNVSSSAPPATPSQAWADKSYLPLHSLAIDRAHAGDVYHFTLWTTSGRLRLPLRLHRLNCPSSCS